MRNYAFFCTSFVLIALAIISCEEETDRSIVGKWALNGYVENFDSIAKYGEQAYIVEFHDDKSITANLDVNNCFSSYSLDREDLNIEGFACTEACCDSESAETMIDLLSQITSYDIGNTELNLHGPDGMVLRFDPVE